MTSAGGQTSSDSQGSTTTNGATSDIPDGTGPIAEGSAGSGTSGGPGPGTTTTSPPPDGSTTEPADESTTTDEPPSDSSSSTTGRPSGSSSGGEVLLTCDQIFDTATDYLLCDSDDTSCSFSVTTGNQSCDTICMSFGETCLGANDNPGGASCTIQGPYGCGDTSKGTTICICSRTTTA